MQRASNFALIHHRTPKSAFVASFTSAATSVSADQHKSSQSHLDPCCVALTQQGWNKSKQITSLGNNNIIRNYNANVQFLHNRHAQLYNSSRGYSTTTKIESNRRDLSVAIVGTGPSGMYTAKYLRSAVLHPHPPLPDTNEKKEEQNYNLKIDMIEQLPTPYGLVRSGVAPDHPEVKNVEHDFDFVFTSSLGDDDDSSSIEFMGNVTVGKDVSLDELRNLYDVVILCYGCESDKKLGIEGCNSGDDDGAGLRGILSAREFVAWYNGHPNFVHIGDEISQLLSSSSSPKQVVVIGQGNVALDCARILAKGKKGLIDTDIASHALDILGDESVDKVTVLGRRGHVQGAFTIKELRELTKLKKEGHDVSFYVRQDELDMGLTPSTKEELQLPGSRPKVRIDKLLRKAAAASSDLNATSTKKKIELRFLLQPMKFVPDEVDSTRVGSLVCQRTELQGEPGKQVAVATGEEEVFPVSLVLVSIGYKGIPLPELEKEELFDYQKGIVRNIHGKVSTPNDNKSGLYVSGWLKRGPSGIIGTNIADAKDTVASIMFDLKNGEILDGKGSLLSGRRGLTLLLKERGVKVVDWELYQRIDADEKKTPKLRTEKQPREKITSVMEMLQLCE